MSILIYHLIIGTIFGLYVVLNSDKHRIILFIGAVIFYPVYMIIELHKRYKEKKKLLEEIDKRNKGMYN